jgi:hypothetical protein
MQNFMVWFHNLQTTFNFVIYRELRYLRAHLADSRLIEDLFKSRFKLDDIVHCTLGAWGHGDHFNSTNYIFRVLDPSCWVLLGFLELWILRSDQ